MENINNNLVENINNILLPIFDDCASDNKLFANINDLLYRGKHTTDANLTPEQHILLEQRLEYIRFEEQFDLVIKNLIYRNNKN